MKIFTCHGLDGEARASLSPGATGLEVQDSGLAGVSGCKVWAGEDSGIWD